MNTQTHLVDIPATYTGGTITLKGQPVLVTGMAVRLRHIGADSSVIISYDRSDPMTPGMVYSYTTLIRGVRLSDLQPRETPETPLERMQREEASGLSGYHVNHTTKGA